LIADPVENNKVILGRLLFFDKDLSADRKISCGSCHLPYYGFSDNKVLSDGVNGNKTHRNTPALANVSSFKAHYRPTSTVFPQLMWDSRFSSIQDQSRLTFENPHEMGLKMSEVVARIKEKNHYKWLWNIAFANEDQTENQVLEAIEAFVNAIGSHDSKLDRALSIASASLESEIGEIDTVVVVSSVYYDENDTTNTLQFVPGVPTLTESEDRGRVIFIKNCTKCHSPIRPFQEVFEACNGLDMDYLDKGLGSLSNDPTQNGVFKSPSLRNIALTAPYMHDGRFKTLREVVDFYDSGVKNHPNLHPLLKKNGNLKMNLTEQEKRNLISFLGILTDHTFLEDKKFANPYK
jgi:cytochrome c peroxidase